MTDYDCADESFADASLAASDSLALQHQYGDESCAGASHVTADFSALPPRCEIDECESFSVASIATDDSVLLLPPEYEDMPEFNDTPEHEDTREHEDTPEYEDAKRNAAASLAAADSLALPSGEDAFGKPVAPRNRKADRGVKRKLAVSCMSALLVLIAIIVLSVVLTNTKETPGDELEVISIEGSVPENVKDDNIFSKELVDVYNLLEPRVYNPAALLDSDAPEGMAFNVLVEESMTKSSATPRSIEDHVQRYALLVLYFGTNGEAWRSTAGWTTQSEVCEDWYGVACKNSLVTGIDLDRNNLNGNIPEDFCLLNGLNVIRFSENRLMLPSCMSELSDLRELDLKENGYSGELPSGLYSIPSLKSLQLSDNKFVGPIDALFPKMRSKEPIFPSLRILNLADNDLTGEIPESALRRLPNLDELILRGNTQLSGSLNEMCKGDGVSEIDVDCEIVSCKCCTAGKSCPSSLLQI